MAENKSLPPLEDIAKRIDAMIGSTPLADLKQNIEALGRGALARMQLPTREEFDIQCEVLKRTREKVEALEVRLTELESKIKT